MEEALKKTVLVADDEEIVRRVNQAVLERSGYSVLTANDGEEALGVFRNNLGMFCAVVLDLTMPRMGGEQAFRAIREIEPNMPVVMTSGFDTSDVQATMGAVSRAGFLQKPFAPQDLVSQIQALE